MDMDISRMEHLPQVANQDPEFRIHARFWNTGLRLDMGDNALLRIINLITSPSAFARVTLNVVKGLG
jgi:hypothetical protein